MIMKIKIIWKNNGKSEYRRNFGSTFSDSSCEERLSLVYHSREKIKSGIPMAGQKNNRVGEDSYQNGYNRGFMAGIKARK